MFRCGFAGALALACAALLGGCGGGGSGDAEAAITKVGDAQVLEGDAGSTVLSFPITLDKPVVRSLLTSYTIATAKAGVAGAATGGASCGPGIDYVVPAKGELLIPAGAASASLQVTVCPDSSFEPNETLVLNWNTYAGSGTVTGTIVNDDPGGLNGGGVASGFGRDSNPLTNSDADGRLGFSFAKVSAAGSWQCTRDQVTGLLWEKKSATPGDLHDAAQTYTWSQLAAFVASVNAQALCGYTDWHVPTPEELSSLVDAGVASTPTVDTAWFPNQQAAHYWTSTPYGDGSGANAWFVDFGTGAVAMENKTQANPVRLVSAGGIAPPVPAATACNDSTRFRDHGDGTLSDLRTGLMWKTCAEGFSGASCSGSGSAYTWSDAKARVAAVNADAAGAGLGHSDWRLPTRSELSSLAAREQCFNPAIDTAAFPGAEALGFWTATPYAFNSSLAWAVDFFDGQVAPAFTSGAGSASKRVRLVRAGQ